MNSNYSIIAPLINIKRISSVWVAIFLCLLIFPKAVAAAEVFSDAKINKMQGDFNRTLLKKYIIIACNYGQNHVH